MTAKPQEFVLGLLLTVPWLWGYTAGPNANAVPWMVSAICACLALPLWAGLGNMRRAQVLAASWLAAAVLSTAAAMVQRFGFADQVPLVVYSATNEAFGNLRQRNQFATLTALGFIGLLYVSPRLNRPFAYGCAVLMAAGCAASLSRTGLLLWLLVALAMWMRRQQGPQRSLAATGLVAYGAAVFVIPWIAATVGVEDDGLLERLEKAQACSSRRVLWSNVLRLIASKPWTGWGWQELDYAHFATLYPAARFCDILDNAHNLPLHLAVELGIPLAVAACGAVALWIARRKPWKEQRAEARLGWTVLAAIAIHSLVEYPLWYGPFQLAALSAWALVEEWPSPGSMRKLLAASLGGLALLAAAALDYDRMSDAYRAPEQRHFSGSSAGTVLFKQEAEFAALVVTPLTLSNAQHVHTLAMRSLHYSPEPRVIEPAIESALLLGNAEEAAWLLARYQAAFPEASRKWLNRSRAPQQP